MLKYTISRKYDEVTEEIHGLIVETVMGGLTLFCMALEFFFPQKKEPHAMTQEDIAKIVFKGDKKC